MRSISAHALAISELIAHGWNYEQLCGELWRRGVQIQPETIRRARSIRQPGDAIKSPAQPECDRKVADALREIGRLQPPLSAARPPSYTRALSANAPAISELIAHGWNYEQLCGELRVRGVQIQPETVRRARSIRQPGDAIKSPAQPECDRKVADALREIGRLEPPRRWAKPSELRAQRERLMALIHRGSSLEDVAANLESERIFTTVGRLRYALYGRAKTEPNRTSQSAAAPSHPSAWLKRMHELIVFDETVWAGLLADHDARADLVRKAISADETQYMTLVAQAYRDDDALRASIAEAVEKDRPRNGRDIYLAMLLGPSTHVQLATTRLGKSSTNTPQTPK